MGDLISRAAAIAALPNGWTGAPHQSNMDYGPNVAAQAAASIRALPSATQAGGWMPPEDRDEGYRCLGLTEDGWVCVTWLFIRQHTPMWVTDWYPEREDEPTAFAPLPPAPEAGT